MIPNQLFWIRVAIMEANWHSYLSPYSEIPPDVFFFVEKKSIGAHRFLLAGISPVFRVIF